MRALLVEDYAPLARAMQRQLKAQGYEVIWANDAKQAWAALSVGVGIDLVSLDNDLGPGATGEEIATSIALMHPSSRPSRVVVHTSNDEAALRMIATLSAAGVNVSRKAFR